MRPVDADLIIGELGERASRALVFVRSPALQGDSKAPVFTFISQELAFLRL